MERSQVMSDMPFLALAFAASAQHSTLSRNKKAKAGSEPRMLGKNRFSSKIAKELKFMKTIFMDSRIFRCSQSINPLLVRPITVNNKAIKLFFSHADPQTPQKFHRLRGV